LGNLPWWRFPSSSQRKKSGYRTSGQIPTGRTLALCRDEAAVPHSNYTVFVVCYLLSIIASTSMITFYPAHIISLADQTHLGLVLLHAISEVPMLLLLPSAGAALATGCCWRGFAGIA
jgi:hypothetical protein